MPPFHSGLFWKIFLSLIPTFCFWVCQYYTVMSIHMFHISTPSGYLGVNLQLPAISNNNVRNICPLSPWDLCKDLLGYIYTGVELLVCRVCVCLIWLSSARLSSEWLHHSALGTAVREDCCVILLSPLRLNDPAFRSLSV